jgi:Thrombospondin type 3 repeat
MAGVGHGAGLCPGIANADQLNTDAANTALNRPGADPFGDVCDGDIDGDGYTNAQEIALGKDPALYCPIMRADVDGDGAVSILDLTKAAQYFAQSVPPAPERYKQDADFVSASST